MVYLISYDLKRPGQQYSDLYEGIKALGAWWHYLESTWLVDSSLDAAQIWSKLSAALDKNDNVIIIKVTRDYSGWLPREAWEWVEQRL